MKKGLAIFTLLVVLAAPAMAAPRDDDQRGRGPGDVIARVVRMIKKIVGVVVPLDDAIAPAPPKP